MMMQKRKNMNSLCGKMERYISNLGTIMSTLIRNTTTSQIIEEFIRMRKKLWTVGIAISQNCVKSPFRLIQ